MVRIIPLIILLGIQLIGLGMTMERHGEPKKGKENAWYSLIAMGIVWGLILWSIL